MKHLLAFLTLLPLALSAQQVDLSEQSGKTALTITIP
jgi:hypothetical protein